MQIPDPGGSCTRCRPRRHLDLSSRPGHAYKKAMSARSAVTHCPQKVQMEMKLHGKLMSWTALLLVTHQPLHQRQQDTERRRILPRRHQSVCYPSPRLRKTVLVKTAQLRNVRSALLSMMWGTIWPGWNAFASFTRRASWNGLVGSKNARCTRLPDL